MELAEINQFTLLDQIHDNLGAGLRGGQFEPGETLTIRSLALRFGTSPTPVREALSRLVARNALEMSPTNRSARVPSPSPERLTEIYALRGQLESQAAHAAAGYITKKELSRLRSLERDICRHVSTRNIKGELDLNYEFHFAIYRAARMPVLLDVIDGLWLQCGPVLNLLVAEAGYPHHTGIYHKRTLKALAVGDGNAAAAAIAEDLSRAEWYLIALAREHKDVS